MDRAAMIVDIRDVQQALDGHAHQPVRSIGDGQDLVASERLDAATAHRGQAGLQDDPEALRSAARRGSEKSWKTQDPQIPQSIWYLTDASFVGFRVVRPLRVPSAAEAKKYDLDDSQLEEIVDYAKARASN